MDDPSDSTIAQVRVDLDISTRMSDTRPSPLYGLPNEILCIIFVLGLHSYPRWQYSPTLNYLKTITSIGQYWREVAINNPSLWTVLYYHWWIDKKEVPTTLEVEQNVLSRIQAFLERSKDVTLKLRIAISPDANHIAVKVVRLVLPHLSRFKDLSIWIQDPPEAVDHDPDAVSCLDVLFPLKGNLPRLKRVEFWPARSACYDETTPFRVLDSGAVTPRLSFIVFHGHTDANIHVDLAPLMSLQLTQVSLNLQTTYCYSIHPLNFLQNNSRTLQHIRISPYPLLWPTTTYIVPGSPIQLPALRTLDVSIETFCVIFHHITCPRLETITLLTSRDGRGSDHAMGELNPDSFQWPRIRRLSIMAVFSFGFHMEKLLRIFPSVEHLAIRDGPLNHQWANMASLVFQILSDSSSDDDEEETVLAPNLKTLRVERGQRVPLDFKSNNPRSVSRVRTARPRLRIYCYPNVMGLLDEQFEELRVANPNLLFNTEGSGSKAT